MGLGKRNKKKLGVNLTPNIDEEIFLDVIEKSVCEARHRHSHSHMILDPGSAYPGHARGGEAPSSVIVVCRSRIQAQVAVAVAVGGGGVVAVAVAGLTKRFFNHIQKDFLINVWGYLKSDRGIFLIFFQNIFRNFRHISSTYIDFAHRSGALARPGSRELRAVQIPTSYDAWRPPKRRKNDSEKI